MVLMAAANEHDRQLIANSEDPPAPPARPSRTRLHSFSFPTLSWGTHRLLRCSKNPASSPPPSSPDTPSPDKEKAHRSTVGVGEGSPQRPPQRPWNLRTRRSATTAPRPEGSDDAGDAAPERAPPPPMSTKKQVFSVVLSKEEIAQDFKEIRGTRPPRRPKKRQRTVQRQLDLLYPGLCLADVTPATYKIEER
ncbi:hypothetical protein GUJ93_ZPchr0007g3737 [Zizania palustris]|uniref:Uncharacterized protein n=1 Tax=Zizania palustris TaxID=103762 RepID=A0A8J5T062_ZIZPA|nr:hypothetical protein GUJ93_ZPchr0007g3737 [Zizania palustris]